MMENTHHAEIIEVLFAAIVSLIE